MAKKAIPYDDLDLEVWQYFAHMEPKEFTSIPPSGLIKPIAIYPEPPYPWNWGGRTSRSISHRHRSAFRPVAKRSKGSSDGEWAEASDMKHPKKSKSPKAAIRKPLERFIQNKEENQCGHPEHFETFGIHTGTRKAQAKHTTFFKVTSGAHEGSENKNCAKATSMIAYGKTHELDMTSGCPRTMFVSPISFGGESPGSEHMSYCSAVGDDNTSEDGGHQVRQTHSQGASLVGRLRSFFNTLVRG